MRKVAELMAAWLLFRVGERTSSTLELWVLALCLGDRMRAFDLYCRYRWLRRVSEVYGRLAWELFPGAADRL